MAAILVPAVMCLVVVSVKAQTKTGTTVGQFLLIEPSARAAGMGNAGVTLAEEPLSAYFNPGALGRLERSGVQATHNTWLADITYNYAITAIRMGANTLMLSVTTLNSGDIAVRTVDRPLGTGELYKVTNLSFGLGFGRSITDRFSAGVQVKYVRESIWNSSMNAAALDFGVVYQLPFNAYIGASLSNFGSRASYNGRDLRVRFDADPDEFGNNSNIPAGLVTEAYGLPVFFRVGLGYPIQLGPTSRVIIVADAFHPSDNTESVSFGAEWTFMDIFSARAGYQNLFLEDSNVGLTLGAGVNYDVTGFGFRFDYAWNDYDLLGNTQRFSLGIAF
jgi:long-subunit fatty acid transport protein